MFDRVLASAARTAASRMARRFIAGSTPGEALKTVRKLRETRLAFTADLLGEAVIGEGEAVAYQKTCLDLMQGLTPALNAMPEVAQIDRDDAGPIPRCNLSLKLTSLVPRFDALHAETTSEGVLARLRPILRTARALGAFVNVDMEQYTHKDLTYDLFRRVLAEPEFRDWSDVGIVCQAYLRESLDDLEALRDWAAERGTPVTVRLVKGAYWDYEVTIARQLGWPVPVYQEKWETDANYERCTTSCSKTARFSDRPSAATTSEAWPTSWPQPRPGGAPRRVRDPDASRHGRAHPGRPGRTRACA